MESAGFLRGEFAHCINDVISGLNKMDYPSLKTGIEQIDKLTGGIPAGQVVALLGKSASCKSALLRNLAIAAAAQTNVLFCPLQDGMRNGTKRLIALESGMRPGALNEKVTTSQKVAILEAAERLKELKLSLFADDGVSLDRVYRAISQEFTDCPDTLDPIETSGLVLLDSVSMLIDGDDTRSALRAFNSYVYEGGISVIVSATGNANDLDKYADAGMVLLLERLASDDEEIIEAELAVLKNSTSSTANGKCKLVFDATTLQLTNK